jgi:hypothetical protein
MGDMVEDMEDVVVDQTHEGVENGDVHEPYVIGGYTVNVQDKQIPYFGQLIAAPILILSLTLAGWKEPNYGYGLAVGIVAILLNAFALWMVQKNAALYDQHLMTLPLLGPCSIGYTLSIVLVIWWTVAAFILTFDDPFKVTGNGYFSVWAGFFFSALGVGVQFSNFKNLDNFLRLSAACIVVIAATSFHMDGPFEIESIFALTLASLTLVFCIVVIRHPEVINSSQLYTAMMVMSLLWTIEAALVTFRGPFEFTGNGYFASWAAAFLCIFIAASSGK